MLSLQPSRMLPAWDFVSVAPSSNRMVAAYGLTTTPRAAQRLSSLCPSPLGAARMTRSLHILVPSLITDLSGGCSDIYEQDSDGLRLSDARLGPSGVGAGVLLESTCDVGGGCGCRPGG